MPDIWETVATLDEDTQAQLAGVLETRGADAQQQEMRARFFADIEFPARARVLDVGCGTGVLSRAVAALPGIGAVVGVDTAPALLARARELASGLPEVSFQAGDAHALPFTAGSFDAVLFDSLLSHLPAAAPALAEALRVLRPSGWLGVFDGDYATTTVALADHDPLQACVNATLAGSVNDRWLMRGLAAVARDCGFEVGPLRSHGFVERTEGGYMLTVVERGADVLGATGQVGDELVVALKAEARRRVASGEFFGHIAYASLVARKPADERILHTLLVENREG